MEVDWTTNRLHIELDHPNTGAITVRLHGTLDALSAESMRAHIETLLASVARVVILDLTALSRIDSSGVGVVVSLYKRLRAQGRALNLRGLQNEPLAIFGLLGLTELMTASPPRRAPRGAVAQRYAYAA